LLEPWEPEGSKGVEGEAPRCSLREATKAACFCLIPSRCNSDTTKARRAAKMIRPPEIRHSHLSAV
jgi:hypothetical protein